MFDILSMALNNFKSYVDDHRFEFPTEVGLYSFIGKNLSNKRLGGNGCGKSSLLDAVYWCFYGKTPRGLRGNEVISRGQSTCFVEVEALIGDMHNNVLRSQNPNRLLLNGRDISQDDLQKVLRLGPQAFTYSVLLPQFGESFFDLSPANKLTLFSQIMELDFWLEKSKVADSFAVGAAKQRDAAERELSNFQGKLENTTSDVLALQKNIDSFTTKQEKLVEDLSLSLKAYKKELLEFEQDKKEVEKLLANAKNLKAQHMLDAGIKAAIADKELIKLTLEYGRLGDVGKVCPTCKQVIPTVHLNTEKAMLRQQVKEKEKECKALRKSANDLISINKNIEEFSNEEKKLSYHIDKIKQDISNINIKIMDEKRRSNPYAEMLENKINEGAALTTKIGELDIIIQELNKEHTSISYWVNGFKKIRLYIIEEAIQHLELEINNNLASLGLVDWKVELGIERENKSGGVTKGFSVFAYPPNSQEPIRLEAWSGGEVQRLRLAGDLGLANLIMERAGLTGTVEFHDEPSEHLSQEGLLDLAETLYQRALHTNKKIWLIDHTNLDFGDFEGTLLVSKDETGSHLLWK